MSATARKPRKAKPREAPIMHAVEAAINATGMAAVWRANTGAVRATYKGRERFIRYGVKGAADLTGLVRRTGQRLEVEVKAPGAPPPTLSQQAYGETIRRLGGIYLVVRSVEEALRLLEEAIENNDVLRRGSAGRE